MSTEISWAAKASVESDASAVFVFAMNTRRGRSERLKEVREKEAVEMLLVFLPAPSLARFTQA